ncbi:MAG: nicotinate phosphoribosyltransferase [Ignavibacteriales bacterium]|nr:nicotinate phosphoribosyltransferase [Ignavibacteriales bacterium]
MGLIDYTATYTDQYQLAMALAYFKSRKREDRAVFDYFFRKPPFGGGYAVFAGLENLIDLLEDFRFDDADLEYLETVGFPTEFLDYLRDFRFRGDMRSSAEGDVVFPTRPILQIEATIVEAQIVETATLNLLNFQTLVATKASRMRAAAGERKLSDFGLRRAQSAGGYHASRAAIIGGFDSTSDVRAGRDFGVEIAGTMAHSFVQSFDDELAAFRAFAEARADDCALLLDTYDTLESGLPNAIVVGKEMAERGEKLKGVRLDSGDLAYLAKRCRAALDEAGLEEVNIAVSNQLDEYVIKSLLEQNAPIDLFGVGTKLAVGAPDAALDGVYKLARSGGNPRLKLSETTEKITLPNRKQVYRLSDESGDWIGADLVALEDEKSFSTMRHPFDRRKRMNVAKYKREPQLRAAMTNGERVVERRTVKEISDFRAERLAKLPDEYRRFDNPHIYKVGLSDGLYEERDKLIEHYNRKES